MAETKVKRTQYIAGRLFTISVSETTFVQEHTEAECLAHSAPLVRAIRAAVACIEREMRDDGVTAPPGFDMGEFRIQVPLDIDGSAMARRIADSFRATLSERLEQ